MGTPQPPHADGHLLLPAQQEKVRRLPPPPPPPPPKFRRGKRKRSQMAFACCARSTLEAAPVEIINESCFRDLSKWTGNKSVLIGHRRGRRQGGGRWFSCLREAWRGVKIQVSQETRSNLPRERAREPLKMGINVLDSQGEGQLEGLMRRSPRSARVQSCLLSLFLCIQM